MSEVYTADKVSLKDLQKLMFDNHNHIYTVIFFNPLVYYAPHQFGNMFCLYKL